MNKSNGYMYSYIDRTYNPIKGDCTHQCPYCYMKAMRRRFRQDPTLRLDEKALGECGFKTMVTVEPIMAFSSFGNFAELIASDNPIQVNFGFNTSRDVTLPEPSDIDFIALVLELDNRNINVHFKKNIR